jgi:hypothetical protein
VPRSPSPRRIDLVAGRFRADAQGNLRDTFFTASFAYLRASEMAVRQEETQEPFRRLPSPGDPHFAGGGCIRRSRHSYGGRESPRFQQKVIFASQHERRRAGSFSLNRCCSDVSNAPREPRSPKFSTNLHTNYCLHALVAPILIEAAAAAWGMAPAYRTLLWSTRSEPARPPSADWRWRTRVC